MLDLNKTLLDKRDERFRKGVYQYLIDHSGIMENGVFKVVLFIGSSHELWRRIEERIKGNYTRYDVIEEERKAKAQHTAYRKSRNAQERRDRITREVKENGSMGQKLALWGYTRLHKYLYEKSI